MHFLNKINSRVKIIVVLETSGWFERLTGFAIPSSKEIPDSHQYFRITFIRYEDRTILLWSDCK